MSLATARGLLDWRAVSGWTAGAPVEGSRHARGSCPAPLSGVVSLARVGRACSRHGVSDRAGQRHARHSKGCGGVMRVAPLGCAGLGGAAFEAGARAAALTHRHHTSDAASGFQARLVDWLVGGEETACGRGGRAGDARRLARVGRCARCGRYGRRSGRRCVGRDLRGAGTDRPRRRRDARRARQGLGGRRGARHRALLRAALLGRLRGGAARRRRHLGDSDSTASIAGAMLGAAGGTDAIPAAWRDKVEGATSCCGSPTSSAGGGEAGA